MLMSLHIKKGELGFSIIEALVILAIFGTLSIIGMNLLVDTLATRSKQTSIEGASDNFRLFTSTITTAIQSARSISIPDSSTLKITGNPCRTVRLNLAAKSIEQAIDSSPSCLPPESGFAPVTKDEIIIQNLEFSPIGDLPKFVTIKIDGFYKDGLNRHPINFSTTITPRIAL